MINGFFTALNGVFVIVVIAEYFCFVTEDKAQLIVVVQSLCFFFRFFKGDNGRCVLAPVFEDDAIIVPGQHPVTGSAVL